MDSLEKILKRFGRYDKLQNTLYLSVPVDKEVKEIADKLKILIQPNLFEEHDGTGRKGTDTVLQEGI